MGIAFPHAKGAFCPRRSFPHYAICCFDTPFLYEADGVLLHGSADELLIIPPGQVHYHGPQADAAQGFVNDWMHIAGADFGRLLEQYPLPVNRAFSVGRSHFLRKYMKAIQRERSEAEPGWQDMVSSQLTQMLIDLYRTYTSLHTLHTPQAALGMVRKAIASNPAESWTLAQLASLSGYSVSRFSQLYRSQYGCAPMQDLLRQRLELAKQLLSTGQASVSFTADSCGFRSVAYFSRYFTAAVGCTPTQYLQQSTGADAIP